MYETENIIYIHDNLYYLTNGRADGRLNGRLNGMIDGQIDR